MKLINRFNCKSKLKLNKNEKFKQTFVMIGNYQCSSRNDSTITNHVFDENICSLGIKAQPSSV